MSVRIDACLALRHFAMDDQAEARLRYLMGSDRKREVRRAAMNALLFHWSRPLSDTVSAAGIEIRRYLEGKGVSRLYHITSERNLASIKGHGAILSASELRKQKATGVVAVSNKSSRSDDRLCGADRWVHLFFHFNQPMFYRAQNAYPDLLILEVDLGVLAKRPAVFSDVNVAASRALVGSGVTFLQTMNLEPFARGSWQLGEKGVWQAETLVYARVDWEFVSSVQPFAEAAKKHRDSVSPQQRDNYLYRELLP